MSERQLIFTLAPTSGQVLSYAGLILKKELYKISCGQNTKGTHVLLLSLSKIFERENILATLALDFVSFCSLMYQSTLFQSCKDRTTASWTFTSTCTMECNEPVICNHREGWGIAGLKCRAITFRVSSQCRGNDGVLTLGSLPQGYFLLLRAGQRAKF